MAGLLELLASRAGDSPDAVAAAVDGGDELTYLSWERRSNALARGLAARGVARGQRIVVCFATRHWVEFAIACAGVAKVGAVAVPVSADRSGFDRASIVEHCGATLTITAADLAWLTDGQADTPGGPVSRAEAVEIAYPPGHLRPLRPVARSEEDVMAALVGVRGDCVLHAFAVGSDAARSAQWAPLAPGGPTVVTLEVLGSERLCAVSAERAVDTWWLAPAAALFVAESGALDRHDLSSLRRVELGGPRPPAAVISRLTAAFAGVGAEMVTDAVSVGPRGEQPAPGGARFGPAKMPEHGVFAGQVSETVAAVFQRVLGVDRVGAGDDFFALGGDEMAGLKALRLLDDALHVRLSLVDLVGAPTVGALAERLDQAEARSDAGPAGAAAAAPVAFSQEGMLWQEQFVPGSQNLPPLVRRFRGPLRVDVLEATIDEIVRRHEPLRSRFELRDGRPVQIVAPHRAVPLPVHDLSALAPAHRDAELASALAHAGRPFDLVGGPLFAPALFRFAPDDHVVVFRVHHSVYDDWSVSVFRRELSALYGAFAAGETSPLADLTVGFAEFSRNQRRRLAGPVGAAQLAWWKSHLAGAPWCAQLPVDDPDRAEGSPQHSARPVTVELTAELHAGVRALARRRRATPFMAMLAAFEVLVHRYTGQDDLLMASVVANRNRPELEPMIGCFTKKILLRQDMAGDPTFAEVLDRTRVSVLGALPNQDLPFETVLQETLGAAAAEHGLAPYVGVMFQGVTPQVDEVVLPGLTTSGYDTSATTTRAHFAAGDDEAPLDGGADRAEADTLDHVRPWGDGLYAGTFLILSLVETPEATSLVARGAFHRPAVERLLDSFVTLLGDVVDGPERPVSQLRLLTDDQQRHLVDTGGDGVDTAVDGKGAGSSAHHLFEDHVAATPSAVAVAVTAGADDITYAGVGARADDLAGRLRASGVGRGSLVGICLDSPELCVVAVLAAWKAGAGYVGLDPADDAGHLAWVVADASVEVVVARPHLCPGLADTGCRMIDLTPGAEWAEGAPVDPSSPANAGTSPDDVALVFYGSGESAVERGVVIDHGAVVNLVGALGGILGPAPAGLGVWLGAQLTDDAFVRQLAALLGGHHLCVAPAAEVASLVVAGAVDVLDVTPTQLEVFVAGGLNQALLARAGDVAAPTIVVGFRGAPDRASWATLRALSGARAHLVFGPPECGFGATADAEAGAGGRITIGRSLDGVTTEVVGPSGVPVPVQVTGDLYVGGAGLARGYVGEPADHAGHAYRFVTRTVDQQVPSVLFRTGQRARRLPDGRIEVVGTAADTVALRGFSVDTVRLAAAVASCPGVSGARVVAEHDPTGAPRLVARVVPGAGALPTLGELRAFLWSRLPGCAWPAAVVVDGDPRPRAADEASGVAEEVFLAALWAEVAGVERVSAAENYWQAFPFLDVVTRAAMAGIAIGSHRTARNRTVATLAVDMAARRMFSGT
ncbi:MAG: condensation domain-containing protein [Acidimicrobiales bacterium]